MNSLLDLGRCLGDVSTPAFQRFYQHQLVQSLDHYETITFSYLKRTSQNGSSDENDDKDKTKTSISKDLKRPGDSPKVAHQAGTNCLAIDNQVGRFLATGGSDSTIRLWDLERDLPSSLVTSSYTYYPAATLPRSNSLAHTHAITSLSVYPFDPAPTTLLSTSHDKTFLLSSITPASLEPVHKIQLDFTPYCHTVSPHPSSSPLVAVGTSHPAIRLIDLRTGLSTHSLPGHNGAIYTLQFSPSPRHPHLLISGSADSRILLFDIRRANPAFASLDLDDVTGYPTSTSSLSESRPLNLHLNYAAQAHAGPVTGLSFIPSPSPNGSANGTSLISAGHDNRIRLWDLSTGRNELVHFGPRIRNSRIGTLSPLILPSSTGRPNRETLLWPNDDGRGDIYLHSLREGTMLSVFKTKGVEKTQLTTSTKKGIISKTPTIKKMTTKGRINALALRYNSGSGHGIEIYSAHGDGSISCWMPKEVPDLDEEIEVSDDNDDDRVNDDDDINTKTQAEGKHLQPQSRKETVMNAEQSSRKRKRDLIGDLVQGLTKKNATFM